MGDIYLLFSIVAAATPALCYLVFIWWLDRYEREPVRVVLGTFLWGAVGAIIIGIRLSVSGIEVVSLFTQPTFAVSATVVAPLAEEPAKALVLFMLLGGKHFDNTTDGLVYGAATGLGFAMTENFLYFLEPYSAGNLVEWQRLVMVRGSFTALMHCAASASFGAMLGYFRFQSKFKVWVVAPISGYLIAVAIHASFNGMLVATGMTGDESYSLLGLAIVPVAGLALFIVTQLALVSEHKMICFELEEEARNGVLPVEHARIIPFVMKRRKADWLPPGVDREKYVRAATLLAFRRHQARLQGHDVGSKNKEIHTLRQEVHGLVNPDVLAAGG